MIHKLRYSTLLLFILYLISNYYTFWVETDWGIYFYLYLPVAILISVILFGTNLTKNFNVIIRVTSTIFLLTGLGIAYKFICCSGEQGAAGTMIIGAPIIFLTFVVYVILWLIQKFKKT